MTKRDALLGAIEDLSTDDVMVVTKRARLGRDLVEIRKAEKLIKSKGARLYSLELGYNETINDQFQNGIRDLTNEDERRRISQRTSDVMQYLKSQGRFTGRAPIGSRVEVREDGKKYLTSNTSEQSNIDQVRAWKREGFTSREIIALCEHHEIKTRSGNTPAQSTISRWTQGIPAKRPIKAQKAKNPNLIGRKARPRLEDQLTGLWALISTCLESGLSHAKITERVESAGYRNSKGNTIKKSQITSIIKRNRNES